MKKRYSVFFIIILLIIISVILLLVLNTKFIFNGYLKTKETEFVLSKRGSFLEESYYDCYKKTINIDLATSDEIEIRPYNKKQTNIENIYPGYYDSYTEAYDELYNNNGVRYGYIQKKNISSDAKYFKRTYKAFFEDMNNYYILKYEVNTLIENADKVDYLNIEKRIVEDLNNITHKIDIKEVKNSDTINVNSKELITILDSGKATLNQNATDTTQKFNDIRSKITAIIHNDGYNYVHSIVYENKTNTIAYGRNTSICHKENGEDFYIDITVLTDDNIATTFFNQCSATNFLGKKHIIDAETSNYKAFYFDKQNSDNILKDNYSIVYKDKTLVIKISYTGKTNNNINERNKKIEQNKKIAEEYFQKIKSIL